MNPISRDLYEAYLEALSHPLKDDLAKKMERIRKELLELPPGTADEEFVRAYRKKIPEVCVVLEEHSLNFHALYDGLPEAPEGLEVFSPLSKKVELDGRTFFSLQAAFETCLENRDFELALAINEQQNPKQRELYLRQLIKTKFPFDETTEEIPEEFKRLYQLLEGEQYILIWETVYPEGADGPILQNPKILRQFAKMTQNTSLKDLLLAKADEIEYSWWCTLY